MDRAGGGAVARLALLRAKARKLTIKLAQKLGVVRGQSLIMGDRRDGEVALRVVLAAHRSVPLPQLIAPVLQTSQNWFAEQLLKTIGRETAGEAGLEDHREVGLARGDAHLRHHVRRLLRGAQAIGAGVRVAQRSCR